MMKRWSAGWRGCWALLWVCAFVSLTASAAEKAPAAPPAETGPSARQAEQPDLLGKQAGDFRLQDFQGQWHALADLADKRLVVVAFVGTECPLARLYGSRLAELSDQYAARDVAFLGIDSNQQDAPSELAAYAKSLGIEFPLLKDLDNKVADQLGAQRTPEVFVLDQERMVRYRGRIDDQFGVGFSRPAPTRHDLVDALEALLADKEVPRPMVAAVGCRIGRVHRDPRGEITYASDVARILRQHCVECHRAGNIGPFVLDSYVATVGWGETIREVVENGRMPPWHANPAHGEFINDRRLPDADRELLLKWIENGSPEGPPITAEPEATLAEGWRIAQPDLVLEMPRASIVPAKGVVEYRYFPLDHEFPEDAWVRAAEARPGNRAVVHHMILFYMPPGGEHAISPEAALFNILAAYTPGMPTWTAPDGLAKRIPAGSKLYLQMHYTPNGTRQTDLSSVGLIFADPKTVEKQLITGSLINFRFRIPAGDPNFEIQASKRFDRDIAVVSMTPHMHLRGKSFNFKVVYPDGSSKILLDVPRYDFNWQNTYMFREPQLLPAGSTLVGTAIYDNSADNPANPDPSQSVTWGDQTWQEMFIGQFESIDPGAAPLRGEGLGGGD